MSPRNFRKISHPELELSLYLYNFSKEVSQLTDWQTYKEITIIWNLPANIPDMSSKCFKELSYLELEMFLYLCTDILGISSKRISKDYRKISHPELDISLFLSIFSKEVSQLTDWEIYKKFRIIWKWCNNILGVSKKIQKDSSFRTRDIPIFV